jgi:hypothetical protein
LTTQDRLRASLLIRVHLRLKLGRLASWLRQEAAALTALRAACAGLRLRHHWHVRATQCRIGSASRWLSVRFDRTRPQPWWWPDEVGGLRKTFASCGDSTGWQYRRHAPPRVPWRAGKHHSRSRTQFGDLADQFLPGSQVILVLGNVREAFDQQAGLGLRPGGKRPGGGAVTGFC